VSSFRIEKLARHHVLDGFDCGEEALNRFLLRFAFPNQQAHASQTYLGLAADEVAGFYTLVVGEVAQEDAPERVKKGLARHPVPIMLLARMGVSRRFQGQGVGKGLVKDAIMRTLAAADIAGIRAFAVHAKNEQARAFYERFDFISSPTDPLHLFVLIKDLRHVLGG
jgi:GNAT superfamily N-acetyltransferase